MKKRKYYGKKRIDINQKSFAFTHRYDEGKFAFEKFQGTDETLTTSMKSVGEAMSIGRNFKEAIQKALRSIENNLDGFTNINPPNET